MSFNSKFITMKRLLLFKAGMFIVIQLCLAENLSAQAKKNADGYSVFTHKELERATLNDLSPGIDNKIDSYTVTFACPGKDLHEIACMGDTLSRAFHTYLEQVNGKRCLCYFDKIVDGAEPLKGFVIEVVPK